MQLMVFNPTGQRGAGQEYILCNPRIISTGKNTEVGEEGCLSFPNIVDGGLILGDVEVRGPREPVDDSHSSELLTNSPTS